MVQKSFVNASVAKSPRISGTREWSTASANCQRGCSHDCRYCYAKERAVRRFGQMTEVEWTHPTIREAEIRKRWKHIDGTIMFPTAHDLLPEFIPQYLVYLRGMLSAGNRVLIVSKPHLPVIEALCRDLAAWKPQILFRFTIGAADDRILKYWEPGAPAFDERLASLRHAHAAGYATSVSMEPMLDVPNAPYLVQTLSPFAADSIWLGKMNKIRDRVIVQYPGDQAEVDRIRAGQSDAAIRELYAALRDHPLVRWKESIKDVLGLALAARPGEDR